MTLPGLDVSNWQGAIDWQQVAASGCVFAFAKASEGVDFTDNLAERNWREMKRVGIQRGLYHFARPSRCQPEEEADFFLSVIHSVGGLAEGDLLALDLEDTDVPAGVDLLDWALLWLRYVEQAVGFKPLLYSGVWYMRPHRLIGSLDLAEYGLWLAAYQATEPLPPEPWEVLAFWQHTDKGQVPGIAGPVDLDLFNGDLAQIGRYGKSAAAPTAAQSLDLAAIRTEVQALIDHGQRLLSLLPEV